MLFCPYLITYSSISRTLNAKEFPVNLLPAISSFPGSLNLSDLLSTLISCIKKATAAPDKHSWVRQFQSEKDLWDFLDRQADSRYTKIEAQSDQEMFATPRQSVETETKWNLLCVICYTK